MLSRRVFIFPLLIVLGLQISCSSKTNQEYYSNQGFSIIPASSWVFSKDNKDSLFGEREVVFKLGELSFTSFYINNSSVDFTDFVDTFIRKALPQVSESSTKLQKETFIVNNYQGFKYTIVSNFLGEEKTYLYAIEIPCGDKKIFSMSLVAEEAPVNIEQNLKDSIKTLKFNL